MHNKEKFYEYGSFFDAHVAPAQAPTQTTPTQRAAARPKLNGLNAAAGLSNTIHDEPADIQEAGESTSAACNMCWPSLGT